MKLALITAATVVAMLTAAPVASAQEGQPGLPGCAGPCGSNIGLPGTSLAVNEPVSVFQIPLAVLQSVHVPVLSLGVFGSSSQNPGVPATFGGAATAPSSAVGAAGSTSN